MIHRLLYNLISQGFAAIQADPTILDELFKNLYGLSDEEMATIHTWWSATPPKVFHGFSKADEVFPSVSIILLAESEKEMVLGDEGEILTDPEDDPDVGADYLTAMWQHQYGCLCYSKNIDVTTYLYETVKAIILLGHDYLVQNDVHGMKVSGSDLKPDPNVLPAWLFYRQLIFQCDSEFFQLSKSSKLGKAFKVTGLWSPIQTTGVAGGITTP